PSPSVSGLAGTIVTDVSQVVPAGQSASATHVPCPRRHVPTLQKPVTDAQSASLVHDVPASISTQSPVDSDTVPVPPVGPLPPPWRGSPVVPSTAPIVIVNPSVNERMTRSPALPLPLRSVPGFSHPLATVPRCAHSTVRKRTLRPVTR